MSKKLCTLFFTLLKIGLFTFGGGYAMIAFLENEFVSKRKWLDHDEFLDMTAIAESTPGPIAINAATYIGYRNAGILGAIVATIGVCIPSFVIIFGISLFFDAFLSLTWVGYAFQGIRVCALYLIFSAGVRMFGKMKKNAFNLIVFTITFTLCLLFSLFAVKFSSVFFILSGGVAGIVLFLVGRYREGKK